MLRQYLQQGRVAGGKLRPWFLFSLPDREGGSHGLSFHPEAAAAARSLPSWPHDYSLHQKTLPAGVCMLFGEGAFPAFLGLGSLNSRDVTRVGEKGSDVGRYGSCGSVFTFSVLAFLWHFIIQGP